MDYYWLIGTILTLLGVIIAPFATEINVIIRKVFKRHDKQGSLNVSFEYGGMFNEGILLNYSPSEIYDYEKFK